MKERFWRFIVLFNYVYMFLYIVWVPAGKQYLLLKSVLWFSGVLLYTGNTFMVQFHCFHWLLHLLYVCGYFCYSIIYCVTSFSCFFFHFNFASQSHLIFFLSQVLPLPNIPFFWVLFRTYSHWRALQVGSVFLEILCSLKETVVEGSVDVANIWIEQFRKTYCKSWFFIVKFTSMLAWWVTSQVSFSCPTVIRDKFLM